MNRNTIEPDDSEEVDRAGMPSIGRNKRGGKVARALVLVTLGGLGVAWATIGTGGNQQRGDKAEPRKDEVANHLAALVLPEKPAQLPADPPPVKDLLNPTPPTDSKPAQVAKRPMTWEERKFGFVEIEAVPMQAAASASAGNEIDAGTSQSPAPASPAAPAAAPASFAARLEAPAIDTVRAYRLPDPDYLLAAGRLLDCLLDTRIDSTLPGRMKCHLDSDVYSESKRVKLMEAGTELLGEQAGGMLQGQERQFALFLRARTPNGVGVNLNSPATDALGASGITGWVDTQFGKRFGAAIGIALIQDAVAIAVARQSSGGGQNTFVLGNTAQAGTSLAEKALEASLNIPPILHTNQGARIQVMLARDIDFRDVYALQRTAP